jgi:anti-anti-sigma factor
MNPTTHLAVVTEHHGWQRSVLRLQGELDASNRDHLHRVISSALENRPPLLVVDLSGLGFTDCAGLSVLVWAHKRLAGCGHRLVITGTKPTIQRLLHLTGLGTYLHLSNPETVSGSPEEDICT